MQGVPHRPLTRPHADILMKSPPGVGAGRFVGKTTDSGRKRDKLRDQQGTTFVFGERCESTRLQASIDQQAAKPTGNFNMTKCANPDWRSGDRSKWVSPKPFVIRTSQGTTPRMQKK